MDLAEQLLGRELFRLYESTAILLAARLKVEQTAYEGPFDRARRRWMADLKRGGFDPTNDRTLVLLLGRLALRVSDEDCVSYDLGEIVTSDPTIMQHQLLLHDFAAEYTLLEFVRGLHTDIHFMKTSVRRLYKRPVLVTWDPAELAYLFREVRRNPELLLDYPRLLKIPE